MLRRRTRRGRKRAHSGVRFPVWWVAGPVEVAFDIADAKRRGSRRRREHHITPPCGDHALVLVCSIKSTAVTPALIFHGNPQRIGQQLQPTGDLSGCRLIGEDRHLIGVTHARGQRHHHPALVIAVNPGPACSAGAPSDPHQHRPGSTLGDGEGDEVDALGELA